MSFPTLDVRSGSDACRDDSVEISEYVGGSSFPTVRGFICSETPEESRSFRLTENKVVITFRGDGDSRNDGRNGFLARIGAVFQGSTRTLHRCHLEVVVCLFRL